MIPDFVTLGESGEPGPRGEASVVAADLLRRGQRAARVGERARAARLLRAVLIADPASIEARLWLAAIAEEPQEALHLLTRVLREHPGEKRAVAGLQWACERLAVERRTQPALPLPSRPQVAPLPAARPVQRRRGGRLALTIVGLLAAMAAALAFAGQGWARAEWPGFDLISDLGVQPLVAWPTPTATDTPAPTLTATPSPTATAAATSTPTPLPPTATPMPTEVPPTAAPTEAPPTPTAAPQPAGVVQEGKWIEVILSEQVCIAWEGETEVRRMVVSTGIAQYPTVTGTYRIYAKLRSQTLRGPGYNLPDVPHVMYFFRGFGLHGTYWHSNFGTPMSHGCINLTREDAAWLFAWADPEVPEGDWVVYATAENPGTPVVVRW